MQKETAGEKRATLLYDMLAGSPKGVTVDDIANQLDCRVDTAYKTIRTLRILLGDSGDTIAVPCVPNGSRQRWLYTLAAGVDGTREWTDNRLLDTESRLVTIKATMATVVQAERGKNPRGVQTRKAKVIHKAISRVLEDLAEISE